MRTAFAILGLPIAFVTACAAPSSESDADVDVHTNTVAPSDCREAFEDLWGADHATLPDHSNCGTPTGGAAGQFPSNESGGKMEACLNNCNNRYGACIDRCGERYPDRAPPPADGPTPTLTKTVKGIGSALPGATSSQGAGMQYTPPPAPDPSDIARGKCIASCGTVLQACSRSCVAYR